MAGSVLPPLPCEGSPSFLAAGCVCSGCCQSCEVLWCNQTAEGEEPSWAGFSAATVTSAVDDPSLCCYHDNLGPSAYPSMSCAPGVGGGWIW